MRNLSPTSLAKIAIKEGNEPINIIRIYWTNIGYIDYADRTFGQIQGKLLSLSDVEDVINITGNTSSTSVNLTLDDSDGSLKEIFNNADIHRRRVQVLQWFADIPISEAFVIFEGEIASPITWNEGDRTLTFDVLSKLYDREVGFSIEEGQFNWAPPELFGVAWPLVFGTVIGIQALKVDTTPTGLTGEDIGLTDLRNYNEQLANITKTKAEVNAAANYCFLQAIACYALADNYADQQSADGLYDDTIDYSSEISHWNSEGDKYLAQGNQYLGEYNKLSQEERKLITEKAQKDNLRKDRIASLSTTFPDGVQSFVSIGGNTYRGYFDSGFFNILEHPQPFEEGYTPSGLTTVTDGTVTTKYTTQLPPNDFVYHQGGSSIVIAEEYSITYLAALNNPVILGVTAKRNGILIGVPPNYYSVIYRQFGDIIGTLIRFDKPLSSRQDRNGVSEGWDDEIFVTMQGQIGPNPSDIMKWLITTYTPYTYDVASFATVAPQIDRYGMNFALTSRPNVMKLLADLAFQCRCAIWYNDGKFHIKFLAAPATPVDTITDSDVDMASIEVSYTSTEEIVTKFIAEYKQAGWFDKPQKIIFRKNISRYGTVAETYDFFAYNLQASVEKMAEFWMIRKSTIWKRISFRTYLNKLKIETWDTITLNLTKNVVATGNIDCIVESAKFDTSNWKLVITAWVPVRAGEMLEFVYARPANLPIEYIYPFLNDVADDVDEPQVTGELSEHPVNFSGKYHSTRGRNKPIGDQHDNVGPNGDYTVKTALDNREIQTGIAPIFPAGTYSQWVVKPPTDSPALLNSEPDAIFFAKTVSRVEGNRYKVTGIDPATNRTFNFVATQYSVRAGEVVPEGTPVVIVRKTASQTNDVTNRTSLVRTYTMQVPVWVKPKAQPDSGTIPPTTPPVAPPPPPPPGIGFGDPEGDPDSEIPDSGEVLP